MTGTMSTLDRSGDTKLTWDSDNADEVANAKRNFDDLRGKGFSAFRVLDRDGSKGEEMREFDSHAEKIILVPRMVGG